MIHKISGCLISFCDVQPEERDVIEYGLEQGISAGLGMLITVLVGYALKIGPESLIFDGFDSIANVCRRISCIYSWTLCLYFSSVDDNCIFDNQVQHYHLLTALILGD